MYSLVGQGARIKSASLAILMLFAAEFLTACVPVMVGATLVTGVSVATDRRTLGRNYDDNTLELSLRWEMRSDDALKGNNVSVTAINGIVLLTGEVASDELRRRAEDIASSNGKTLKVVNELQLSGATSLTSRTNDTLITSKVKTNLIRAEAVPANAVKVVTESGKVYLLGLVTRAEAEAAVEAANKVTGVTHIVKVFEYIKES